MTITTTAGSAGSGLGSYADSAHVYVWGQDLSGTLQGAGGIGGLLATIQDGATYFALADANGNACEYVDSAGAIVAHYEFDPYGNLTAATGDKANDFAFLFQTEYLDRETGKYYWKHRYYDPVNGRWLSHDPIGEEGGDNLYVFVANSPVNEFDIAGLVAGGSLDSYLTQIENNSGASVWKFWGVDKALKNLRGILPQVTANTISSGDTKYWYLSKTISLLSGDTADTVFHELVHAHHHLVGGEAPLLPSNRRTHEGLAHAAEAVVHAFWTPGRTGGEMSQIEEWLSNPTYSCDVKKRQVTKLWQAFWMSHHRPSQESAFYRAMFRDVPFDLTAKDFELMETELDMNHSCAMAAEALNRLVSTSRCCFWFTCELDKGISWEVALPVGAPLADVFK